MKPASGDLLVKPRALVGWMPLPVGFAQVMMQLPGRGDLPPPVRGLELRPFNRIVISSSQRSYRRQFCRPQGGMLAGKREGTAGWQGF